MLMRTPARYAAPPAAGWPAGPVAVPGPARTGSVAVTW